MEEDARMGQWDINHWQMVKAIVHIIQQQGQHDFPICTSHECLITASLCGLKMTIDNESQARLEAHNIDLSFDYRPLEAANDEPVVRNEAPEAASVGAARYRKGGEKDLKFWYEQLLALNSAFDYSKVGIAAA